MEKYSDFASSKGVAIPIIQRDYVQGAEVNRVKRDKFLKALLNSLLNNEPLEIDFIYGSSNENGEDAYFLPVDGQQRLTTLALLGWLLNQKVTMKYSQLFKLLTYTSRPSTEQFCRELADYILPVDYGIISEHIKTEPGWFSQRWLSDPSINAMLDFLDATDRLLAEEPYVSNLSEIAERFFTDNPIVFERLDMHALNLNDDLYIKMNARGKLLTSFENWKASFEGHLKNLFPEHIYTYNQIPGDPAQPTFLRYFEYAIEHDWCDMLWPIAYQKWEKLSIDERRKVTYPRIDEYFMHLLDFISRFIYFSSLSEVDEEVKRQKLNGARELYDQDIERSRLEVYQEEKNVVLLFRMLDTIVSIQKQSRDFNVFFNRYFIITENSSIRLNTSKVNLFDESSKDLITLCLNDKLKYTTEIMLWAVLIYLLYHPKNISSDDPLLTEDMTDYLRIVMGWARGKRQRQVKDLKVNTNLRLSDYNEANKIIVTLASSSDLFAALANTTQSSLKAEREKGQFYGTFKYNIIRQLSTCAELHFCFNLLMPSIQKALNAEKYLDRFYEFLSFDDSKRIRILNSYGYKGVCPMYDYYFYGIKDKWNYIFTVDSSDNEYQTICRALTRWIENDDKDTLTPSEVAYYIDKYPDFINARYNKDGYREPCHYFMYKPKDKFQIWALKTFSKSPLHGYNVDPFGYTVEQQYDGYYHLRAISDNSSHGLLWIDDGIYLECYKNGWYVSIYYRFFKSAVNFLNRFEEITDENGNHSYIDKEEKFRFEGRILLDLDGKDRIETALSFIQALE